MAFFLPLVHQLDVSKSPDELLATSGVPTRDAKRRGRGWLPGLADIGWSNRAVHRGEPFRVGGLAMVAADLWRHTPHHGREEHCRRVMRRESFLWGEPYTPREQRR